ncbi:hypothetical protein Efla_000722 [Eimeria flavescens]
MRGSLRPLLSLFALAVSSSTLSSSSAASPLSSSSGAVVSDASLVNRGEAFWLCRSGAAGMACDGRREPRINSSGITCGPGLCCSGKEDAKPFTCKQQPCTADGALEGGGCCESLTAAEKRTRSCTTLGDSCAAVRGSSHCVDVEAGSRPGGAACVCEPPLVADGFRHKCVPSESASLSGWLLTRQKSAHVKERDRQPCPIKFPDAGSEASGSPSRRVRLHAGFVCSCKKGFLLNVRNNVCERKCTADEAEGCGQSEAHNADGCSVGISGRVCACRDGFLFDPQTHACVMSACYTSACGWFEGVYSCQSISGLPACQCNSTFQRYRSGECLPVCELGWRYNRNREMCEMYETSCPVADCGPEQAVDKCVVDKDSGTQLCMCKNGYGIDTATGQCALLKTCPADACSAFGPTAVCVSDGESGFACQCISSFATVGKEETFVLKLCEPVECPDSSICGDLEGVKECVMTPNGPTCSCTTTHKLDPLTGRCVRNEAVQQPVFAVPGGSLRVSATRAPLQFTIKAAPCFSAAFNLSDRRIAVKTYDSNGYTHTTSVLLPYRSGTHTGSAFNFRASPAPGGFDVSFVYELRPSSLEEVLDQTAFRVYSEPAVRKAARGAGWGVKGAAAAAVASAKFSPCEIARLEVLSGDKDAATDSGFRNLNTKLNKLPTADTYAPSTHDGFYQKKPDISPPEEPEEETLSLPFPDAQEEPPEPEVILPLQYPPPTEPDFSTSSEDEEPPEDEEPLEPDEEESASSEGKTPPADEVLQEPGNPAETEPEVKPLEKESEEPGASGGDAEKPKEPATGETMAPPIKEGSETSDTEVDGELRLPQESETASVSGGGDGGSGLRGEDEANPPANAKLPGLGLGSDAKGSLEPFKDDASTSSPDGIPSGTSGIEDLKTEVEA